MPDGWAAEEAWRRQASEVFFLQKAVAVLQSPELGLLIHRAVN